MDEIEDYVAVDETNGELLMQVPDNDVLNVTANISLACFSSAIRGSRSWSDLEGCFSMLFSLFTFENIKVTGWPLGLRMPWEDDDVSGTANEASAAAPGALGYHDDTHTHTYTHSHGDLSGFDLFFFISIFGLLFLFIGLCAADTYSQAYVAPARARVKEDRMGRYAAVPA